MLQMIPALSYAIAAYAALLVAATISGSALAALLVAASAFSAYTFQIIDATVDTTVSDMSGAQLMSYFGPWGMSILLAFAAVFAVLTH